MNTATDEPIWAPNEQRIANAQITRFLRFVQKKFPETAHSLVDYESLWQWSVDFRDQFWAAVWEFTNVISQNNVNSKKAGDQILVEGESLRDAKWFPDARLNFAENLLRYRDDQPAIISWNETGRQQQLTYAELFAEVSRIAQWLKQQGVSTGSRIAAYLPNISETVVVMLAAASLGATFSSCSPDFGVEAVVDRFGQIEPQILFAIDCSIYAEKTYDCRPRIAELQKRLPSLQQIVIVPNPGKTDDSRKTNDSIVNETIKNPVTNWQDIPPTNEPLLFEPLPFDHPLLILFSSGTTGVPKCLVHGAGGTLLQHLKEHQLHTDISRDDRLFYFTTCGWMMWNWLVSGLASGCCIVLFDGSPFSPDGNRLFDLIDAEEITVFGVSAKYLSAVEKAGLLPRKTHNLSSLKTVLSTGSPLAPESFDFVYSQIKTDVCLSSISGGTDIVSCFILGNPTLPVWRGELQCRGLGMAVDVFNDAGQSLIDSPRCSQHRPQKNSDKGELVCTKAFPSMPVFFWNDADGEKYRRAYFDRFPNVWHHGDYAEFTAHNGLIISGRSDAVLNPGGVRIGTAEIYRQVESLPEILDCLAVGQQWNDDERIILFVCLQNNVELDDTLQQQIITRIRLGASPRHVPAKIIAVPELPRTKSGKTVEIAVREIIHGRPVHNQNALANPETLRFFESLPELQ